MLGFEPTFDGWFLFGAHFPPSYRSLPLYHLEGSIRVVEDKVVLPDIASIPNFWIFSDIVQEQMVGSTKVPLLRVVPNNAPEENRFWVETCDPYYIPVNKTRVSSISITVAAGPGNLSAPMDLSHPVILILHFRPIPPPPS